MGRVPVLEQNVPNQPSREQLEADPLLHRFTMVFDREGYSPGFLATMKHRRIACLTYHKYPGEDWPREEFVATEVFSHLMARWRDLFNANFEILLYDLTSTYFEINASDIPEGDKRHHGYSRDKRPDCPQVVIALVVTPRRSAVSLRGARR